MIMQNLENTKTEIQILNIGIEEQKTMSLKWFIFLSILSFGLYPIWRIFEAWRFFMQKDKLDTCLLCGQYSLISLSIRSLIKFKRILKGKAIHRKNYRS